MLNILVFGDIILDINLYGKSTRLAPEAPIPVVNINKIDHVLGGCGNIASNLLSLNCNVDICTIIGNDDNGKIIFDLCKKITNNCCIITENRKTTSKYRTFIEKKLHARYDIETITTISEESEQIIFDYILKNIQKYDGIIISDYLKGCVSSTICSKIINLCNENNKYTFIDPKDKNYEKYIGCTFIKPNRDEAVYITNTITNIDNSYECLNKIKNIIKCKACMITYSEYGLCILTSNNIYKHINISNKKEIIDVTGAGDVVLASFVYKFIKTKDELLAANFANYCGQIKITHIGIYSISQYDELNYMKEYNKLIDINELNIIKNAMKNKKLIFSNGCFDILHIGHITYLEKAKQLGDILIIGLNSDESIKLNKGNSRPFNCLQHRIHQLKALECIDFIVVFNDKTPIELLKIIQPDVYVKGGDYNVNELIGKEYAKETICLDYIDNVSSTKFINLLTN